MGLIICENCENQGGCDIVQMSESLYNYYINNKKTEVVKLIYKVKILDSIDDFVHYFSIEDDLSKIIQVENINDFENYYFNVLGKDQVGCVKRFRSYIDDNNINVEEKIVKISN